MKFYPRRRRMAPPIIIISLIDVLIVMLVFLLVSTTYKNQPAIKLTLPESSQTPRPGLRPGVNEHSVVVTIQKEPPNFFVGLRPVAMDALLPELEAAVKVVEINADREAGVGLVLRVYDAARKAKVRKDNLVINTKGPGRK
jgi:biopolymer transport protein ExbD